ncbi:RNA 2'-phosphotransferase [Haloferula sp.]|uniref:RNA 2'-phosphotransferase n=1 Tax=Haloferula sp. TaxID=2497595 RepID=UPI00329C2105
MSKSEQRISRVMSLVLRHDPGSIGLSLDENGWAEIEALVDCLRRDGKRVDRELIEKVVATSDKQRFRISEDGRLIRANQGHSIEIDFKLDEKPPPEWLYHGTAMKSMGPIKREGLLKGERQYVHLSIDKETARKVGSRHGKPVILEVAAQLMEKHGHRFYQAENGVWLTDHVPPDYLNQRFTP